MTFLPGAAPRTEMTEPSTQRSAEAKVFEHENFNIWTIDVLSLEFPTGRGWTVFHSYFSSSNVIVCRQFTLHMIFFCIPLSLRKYVLST